MLIEHVRKLLPFFLTVHIVHRHATCLNGMERCSICLEVIQSEDEAFVENCFHRFCFQVTSLSGSIAQPVMYMSKPRLLQSFVAYSTLQIQLPFRAVIASSVI